MPMPDLIRTKSLPKAKWLVQTKIASFSEARWIPELLWSDLIIFVRLWVRKNCQAGDSPIVELYRGTLRVIAVTNALIATRKRDDKKGKRITHEEE